MVELNFVPNCYIQFKVLVVHRWLLPVPRVVYFLNSDMILKSWFLFILLVYLFIYEYVLISFYHLVNCSYMVTHTFGTHPPSSMFPHCLLLLNCTTFL